MPEIEGVTSSLFSVSAWFLQRISMKPFVWYEMIADVFKETGGRPRRDWVVQIDKYAYTD